MFNSKAAWMHLCWLQIHSCLFPARLWGQTQRSGSRLFSKKLSMPTGTPTPGLNQDAWAEELGRRPGQNGQLCMYGHDLKRDPHNPQLLERHGLEQLGIDHLRKVLKLNRSQATLPMVCRFYNGQTGCKRTDGDGSVAMHVCDYHIKDNTSLELGQRA